MQALRRTRSTMSRRWVGGAARTLCFALLGGNCGLAWPHAATCCGQCIQYEPSLGHGGGSLTQSGDDAPRPSSFPVTDPGAVAAGARLITSASHASTREEDGTQVPPSLSPVAEPGDEDLPGTALLSSTHQPGSTPAATAIWSPGEPNEPATHACGEGTAKTPGLDGSTARGGTEQSSSSRPVLRRSRRF